MQKKRVWVTVGVVLAALAVIGIWMAAHPAEQGATVEEDMTLAAFALSSEDGAVALGADLADLPMEPLQTTDGGGDGFHWRVCVFDGLEVKALLDTESGAAEIISITTESARYQTPQGVRVGDSLAALQQAYPEYLQQAATAPAETEYVYEPEDVAGFYRIRFYLENDSIVKICVENGLDG